MLTKCLTLNELRTSCRKVGLESIVEKLDRKMVFKAADICQRNNRRNIRKELDTAGAADAMNLRF